MGVYLESANCYSTWLRATASALCRVLPTSRAQNAVDAEPGVPQAGVVNARLILSRLCALFGSRRGPRSHLPDANARSCPTSCVWSSNNPPFAARIRELIAPLQIHGQHAELREPSSRQ